MKKANNIYTIVMLGLALAACQKNDKPADDQATKNDTQAEMLSLIHI